ncbi:Fatty acid metabolism regulator protein [Anoxybacillus sp. P3H1B]|uniref:Helix-turn-helix domain containing protein n=1 Tax=Anoxybacteroides rupiense TaxID=311460 RepID=A0ABD5IRP3_9BACL|nr:MULTISPECIES: TetR/AcrR family transcriptional regulator [Anoxybacillus]KXG11405.1 Fatty acid metabolism regulator protein [Anoxybacillus sp. P3H1B]MBB3907270.1 AcrR family transcriptional regulator [Anoxybacillus rupiensis]MBS2773009.1 TetR/AcrR family transcriptional regulator [Anoxybacillus rupiensis]MED5050960.1 helix-turn-helix domain containing protein [Anoxybacillus rupiensis]OQM44832.1 TetR family transcriptional regulator [Anoxybacillus sp. UARK-01]
MNKKETIIRAAMKLFAQKGYHATSMQEIAEQSGMAKGSLYNYFKSKEEIAVSIFRYHYEILFRKIFEVSQDKNLSARERFEKQLCIQIEEFIRHKELVRMHMGEQAVKVNDEVHQLAFRIRARILNWYRQAIIDIYGEPVRRFSLDCAAILNGMLKEYMFYVAVEQKELQRSHFVPFVLRRLDAIVKSLTEEEKPLLNDQMMEDYLCLGLSTKEEARQQIVAYIQQMMDMLKDTRMNESGIIDSLETLEQEFTQEDDVRKFMVEAILLYLERFSLPLWKELNEAIARYFA